MKLLKKFGLALFSMMLFCGISATAFAKDNVERSAELYSPGNFPIIVNMHCRDGRTHNLMCRVRYFDERGNEIFVDKEEQTSSGFERAFDDSAYWKKAKVYFYEDNNYLGYEVFNRRCLISTSAEIGKRPGRITVKVTPRKHSAYDFECRINYFDNNGNQIYSDKYADKNNGFEASFDDCEDWSKAEVTFLTDNQVVAKEFLKR
ncbi:hypothetical protein Z957_01925 [Clostridium sp. K25]|uniref:hypothetical protein n=1 Tax=Clostridium sp. K25 TaxID=1443109 RepID=UPI0004D568FA|nr:hypothetical protein [Clostridium sp. K25]KEI10516.1 hypothetical protein Z957_01925 [Clostridium sp. K25]